MIHKPPKNTDIAILLLAAGNSSRLGQPKQLLPFRGKTLLAHILGEALASQAGKVSVVLGAYTENILPILAEARYPHAPILHTEWAKGMGNSLKAGLRHLLAEQPSLQAVVVSVCDQPYLTATVFDELIACFEKDRTKIVASRYANGATGVPALFGQEWFPELMALDDKAGAKVLFGKYAEKMQFVSFDLGEIDIDTKGDWEALYSK